MATRVSEVRGGIDLLGEDERALVLAFQEGDPDAFASIYRRYRPLAGAVCLKILGNRDDAEEAAQETMLRVLQGLPRFNGRYQLGAWVARIATNVSLDALRARARRPQNGGSTDEIEELRPDGTEDPLELVERLFERERVRAVLEELPPHHREALVLREFEGRSHREIAQRLGMTPAQAKALIHRAKGTFRRAWDGNGRHHGLAALLLLWPARLPGVFRRLFGQAHEAASAAGSGAAAQAATAVASSPAVVANAPGLAERLTATAVTVLVVGSVGVGAVVVHERKSDREPRREPTVAAAPESPVAPLVVEPRPSEPRARETAKPKRHHEEKEKAERPAAEPGPIPEASPAPSPGPSPTPEASPPPPPPAPPWKLGFESSVPVGTVRLSLVNSRVVGKAGEEVVFSQTVAGPLLGQDGSEAGGLYVEYWGSAQGTSGSVSLWIFLDTPAGRYRYDASGNLAAVTVDADGRVEYTFSGTYSLTDGPVLEEPEVVPHDGSIELRLRFWLDRSSLYHVRLALLETEPEAEPAS
ncbi:MAG TPA: sigma-70 family RNA polymerase sigma factor [Actinomycetota bacterium]|nr:sigma-70 family RNA polymerase sigma factor [Actinomycetota bacterium]